MSITFAKLGRLGIVAVLASALLVPAGSAVASAAPAAATGAGSRPSASVPLPTGWQPEGITSGPGSRFYVGSLAGGALYAGDLRSGKGGVLLPGATGRRLVGLFHDDRHRTVWAVGAVGTVGHVWAIDDTSGALLADVTVPGAGFLNDLVVTRKAVWVTDSAVDRLTRIPLGRDGLPDGAASFLPLAGGGWPTAGAFRANGIRALPDGSLIVDHSSAGGLWRVVPSTGTVEQLVVTGSPAIVSGDGMELVGDTLYVVRGSGRNDVTVVELDREHGTWTGHVEGVLSSPLLDVPSTATFARGALWAVNARFGVPDPTTASYAVVRLPVED